MPRPQMRSCHWTRNHPEQKPINIPKHVKSGRLDFRKEHGKAAGDNDIFVLFCTSSVPSLRNGYHPEPFWSLESVLRSVRTWSQRRSSGRGRMGSWKKRQTTYLPRHPDAAKRSRKYHCWRWDTLVEVGQDIVFHRNFSWCESHPPIFVRT